ncbi:hypothetical protein ATPR_0882 [Acetobacter tropicalis NBRC 101654]|uniref:Uncharacterized protein n=1 Tax=Acetobacter tropicalis NBRC 101654 TaxID=749388 RepID=F7VBY3_9PROT|nr:hypothetical protein ATPR_0882 [Acetobacter tropicalis NBRC 101654]
MEKAKPSPDIEKWADCLNWLTQCPQTSKTLSHSISTATTPGIFLAYRL